MAKLAVLAIHGIGNTRTGYSAALKRQLRRELGEARWREVCFVEIDYQKHLRDNQNRLWERVRSGLRWILIRKFLLFYFGDAAAVLYNSAEPNSVYRKIQETIKEAAADALEQLGGPECPVVVIAQSLGCQIVSSYLWDAQHSKGIWADAAADAYTNFLRLGTTRYLLTTGCNIPLIVSGLHQVEPIDKPNPDFRWLNFYDVDDPLGWPLEPVYSYDRDEQVKPEDIPVNVGGVFRHWNPLSHSAYWISPSFIEPAAARLRELLE